MIEGFEMYFQNTHAHEFMDWSQSKVAFIVSICSIVNLMVILASFYEEMLPQKSSGRVLLCIKFWLQSWVYRGKDF